ncbi:MAG: fasciclin domain-containing protein [Phycisphaerae bacterium]|nr:fasciclin domain-containing protein [Phycisphaerae bacterium]
MPAWIALASTVALAATVSLAGSPSHARPADGASSCSSSSASAASTASSDIVDTAVAAGSFKTLAAALTAAGLVDTLKGSGPFTVFAPTDEAFAKLPEGTVENLLKPTNKEALVAVLTYHVVPGKVDSKSASRLSGASSVNGQRIALAAKDGTLRLDQRAAVVKADIECSNGVIHVIDEVILPEQKNVLDVAADAGNFKTLVTAINAAGLADALRAKGPFTILAPTDAAFRKLPPETLASLLKPENKEKLAAILKLHVISGRQFADQVVASARTPATLQGSELDVTSKNGKVMVGKATITATDIDASNGVIHVIDTVLLPE